MSKIDWPGVLFMIMLCIAIPTCYYQEGKTDRARIEAESNQCDCQVDSNTEKE